ncbi:MAG: hypothetical protein NTV73_14450 [Hyphomicrobiales bacterium]|nr:hypothetical protein [Hyphomicrobiales bacterium]
MKSVTKTALVALALLFGAGDFEVTGQQGGLPFFRIATDAQARVGRPLTPVSGAGVARRTTRRVIRRGAVVVAVPNGCPYGSYYGYSLYYCGGTYYQRLGSGYVIVYF